MLINQFVLTFYPVEKKELLLAATIIVASFWYLIKVTAKINAVALKMLFNIVFFMAAIVVIFIMLSQVKLALSENQQFEYRVTKFMNSRGKILEKYPQLYNKPKEIKEINLYFFQSEINATVGYQFSGHIGQSKSHSFYLLYSGEHDSLETCRPSHVLDLTQTPFKNISPDDDKLGVIDGIWHKERCVSIDPSFKFISWHCAKQTMKEKNEGFIFDLRNIEAPFIKIIITLLADQTIFNVNVYKLNKLSSWMISAGLKSEYGQPNSLLIDPIFRICEEECIDSILTDLESKGLKITDIKANFIRNKKMIFCDTINFQNDAEAYLIKYRVRK